MTRTRESEGAADAPREDGEVSFRETDVPVVLVEANEAGEPVLDAGVLACSGDGLWRRESATVSATGVLIYPRLVDKEREDG